MRRVAANRVFFSPTISYANHILEICGRYVVNHYQLDDELELTEWLGGIILIANDKRIGEFVDAIQQSTFHPDHLDTILDFIYTPSTTVDTDTSVGRSVLHLMGVNLVTGKIIDKITANYIDERP